MFVSINYRLAQFGFLGGNEVAAAGGLNAGLRELTFAGLSSFIANLFPCRSVDQQFALRWVQDNIAKVRLSPPRAAQSADRCLPNSSAETRRTSRCGANPPAPEASTNKYVPSTPSSSLSGQPLTSVLSASQIIANGGNTQPPLFNAAILASPFEPPIYTYNASKPQVRHSLSLPPLYTDRFRRS